MTRKRYFFLVLILGALTALSPFSIDMYLPGFPNIAEALQTTAARVSLSLSGYFMGLAGGQLLYGPLLDRFGRKKPLYAGLAVYLLASAACMAVTSIDQLIALRFIQAVGGCAAGVASIAMVRDLFPVKDIPKVISLLILILGASPMLAPTFGSFIIGFYGWRWVFAALFIMGTAALLASIFFLPESHTPDESISLKPALILKGFWEVLGEPAFYTYAFSGAIAFSGMFVYVSGSPIVFMEVFGTSAAAFSRIFALLSIGFIGSSQLNTLALRRFNSAQLVLAATIVQALVGTVLCAGTLSGAFGLWPTLICLFVFLSTIGFINPNAAALCLAPFIRNAGSASALMGALQMGVGASISALVGVFDVKSAVPMTAIMAGSAMLALLVLLLGRRKVGESSLNPGADAVVLH